MTFQEILDGIARHRANAINMGAKVVAHSGGTMVAEVSDDEIIRKINEIEWALQALAEALRDREKELNAVAPHEHAGHASDARDEDFDEVEEAFDEYEKRK